MRPRNEWTNWFGTRIRDSVGWRARGYFLVKLPLAALAMPSSRFAGSAGCSCVTFPAWRALGLPGFGGLGVGNSLAAVLLGIVAAVQRPVGDARPHPRPTSG